LRISQRTLSIDALYCARWWRHFFVMQMTNIETERSGEVLFKSRDGETLVGQIYEPNAPHAAVLIATAMGVPQSFYAHFGRWLASQGFRAMTFDYLGMGRSRGRPLSQVHTDIIRWGEQDASGALIELAQRSPSLPLYYVGHSVGGQIIPFLTEAPRVTRFVTVAAGSGYWRENAPPTRNRAWLLWYLFSPALTHTLGYFPGARLNMVGDLPKGVMQQWTKWCRHPEYIASEGSAMRARFARVETPLTSFSFTDDEMMSHENIKHLHGLFESAPKQMLRFRPDDVQLAKLGHFGFFRKHSEPFWRQHFLKALNDHSSRR
jgi:predicted alpha/beta hydrolase